MAVRSAEDVESEPVLVDVNDECVRLFLDDGTELVFELDELRNAIA